MNKTRLKAFSDGVIAILITIMVLEMTVPHGETFESLRPISGHAVKFPLVETMLHEGKAVTLH